MPAELLLLIADICGVPLQAFALSNTAGVPEATALVGRSQEQPYPAVPKAGEEALVLINQALRGRPDVVPFVLEMIASFVDDTTQP